MELQLHLSSWNATGIMSSASLSSFLDRNEVHIIGISEHWLFNHNMHFLDSINSEYTGFGIADNSLLFNNSRNIGKGGVALLWHKSMSTCISSLDIDSDRICGIQLTWSNVCFYIIQVYAPSSNHALHSFKDFIDLLHSVISLYSDNGTVIVMGDFNAHLQSKTFIKPNDVRGNYLNDMLDYHNLLAVSTLPLCTGATASFVSYGDAHRSLIDHILIPDVKLDSVIHCEITDDHVLNVSRHRPVSCILSLADMAFQTLNGSNKSHIKWKNLNEITLQMYSTKLDIALSNIDCSDIADIHQRIDQRHKNIVSCIQDISDNVLPKTKFRSFLKPYWDQKLRDLHAVMRQRRRSWIVAGKPRGDNHVSFREYKNAKCQFRSQHRKCAEKYLNDLNKDIDEAAELDSAFFWKKVNKKRKGSTSSAGSEVEFSKGHVCRDPQQIATGWGEYFQRLYADTESDHYDEEFKTQVDLQVDDIMAELSSCSDRDPGHFSVSEIKKAVKLLKTKKACGNDNIYNEHLIHGGNELFRQLSMLYTDMFTCGYIPDSLKQGVIITLHKGGRKSKKDPNNYRAITLSSAILKLFERILLKLLECNLTTPFSTLQGGFRQKTGCNMTSVMLKECCLYAKENHSKLYACFLDVQKAFDKIWHNGLFLKLYNRGIRSNLLRVIINLHSNMTSRVIYNGHYSSWFFILQGSRQGGVVSPFMYLCYIDDLIRELCKCMDGFMLLGLILYALTVADDMLLLALSKAGLDKLLVICYQYSCKWRYDYVPIKCSVIVFNETKFSYERQNRQWKLGPNVVNEDINYKHLDVNCNKYLNIDTNIKEASDKLKGTFMSLVKCGLIHSDSLHPLTYKKIYEAAVLPKALYGCETWFSLNTNNISLLERAHRFCVKYMQGLSIRTRTDAALSLLGIFSIESEIDLRKLTLFGQFCRNNMKCWVFECFYRRLASYMVNKETQTGYFPDIYKIMRKYGLSEYFESYIRFNIFPSKNIWKRLVKSRIHDNEVNSWHNRLSAPDFNRFRQLHTDYSPHTLWIESKESRHLLPISRSCLQMIAGMAETTFSHPCCQFCNREIHINIIDHYVHSCSYLDAERV